MVTQGLWFRFVSLISTLYVVGKQQYVFNAIKEKTSLLDGQVEMSCIFLAQKDAGFHEMDGSKLISLVLCLLLNLIVCCLLTSGWYSI